MPVTGFTRLENTQTGIAGQTGNRANATVETRHALSLHDNTNPILKSRESGKS